MIPFIKTKDSLILKFKGSTKTVPLHSPLIPKLLEMVKSNADEKEMMEYIDPSLKIENHPSGLFGVSGGEIYVLGERLPTSLGDRVLDFANSDLPFQPLLQFWENCKKNSNPRAKSDLYRFLETHGHPITSDGCFIGYRNVKKLPDGRLVDWRTESFDNSVGMECTMDRNACDSNPDEHCSRGLHVAKLSYASTFQTREEAVLIEVKVNPADVIAIPTDCNGEKMRVCKFQVMAVNTDGLIKRHVYDEENLPSDMDLSDLDGEEGAESHLMDEEGDEMEEENDLIENQHEEDEVGAVSQPIDFSKPKDDGVRIDPTTNWKSQKRGPNGRFLPKGV